jgi:O-antigen/teichoic acid export membrane protein
MLLSNKSNYLFSLIAALFPAAVGFIAFPVYAKMLGPQAYGTVALMESCQSIGAIILLMGMTTSFYTFYGHAHTLDEKRRVLGCALIYGFCLAFALIILVCPLLPALSKVFFHDAVSAPLLGVYALSIFSDYLLVIVNTWLRVEGRIRAMATNAVTLCCVQHSLTFCSLLLMEKSLEGFVMAFFGSKILAIMLCAFRLYPFAFSFTSIKTLRAMIAFGAPLIMTSLTGWMLLLSDRFFIDAYASLADIGVYAVAYKFSSCITLALVQPFMTVWEPMLFKIYGSDQNKAYMKLASDFKLYLSLLVALFSFQLLFMGDLMALLFPHSKFLEGVSLFPFMIASQLLMAIGEMWGAVCRLNKTSRFALAVTCIAMGVKVMFNFILISPYMLMGIAAASLLAELCSQATMAYYAYSYAQKRNLFFSLSNCLLFACFTLLVFLKVAFDLTLSLKLTLCAIIGGLCLRNAFHKDAQNRLAVA